MTAAERAEKIRENMTLEKIREWAQQLNHSERPIAGYQGQPNHCPLNRFFSWVVGDPLVYDGNTKISVGGSDFWVRGDSDWGEVVPAVSLEHNAVTKRIVHLVDTAVLDIAEIGRTPIYKDQFLGILERVEKEFAIHA